MRKLGSWTDGFNQYMDGKGSPPIFTKWAGIFAIACALERRCFIRNAKGYIYPNIFLLVTGPAGVGKTLATKQARRLLKEVNWLHIAPTSVTKASLVDALVVAERKEIYPMETPSILSFNALNVVSNELGTFLPQYDNEFMSFLTDVWDGEEYAETRRTAKISIKMEAPLINLAAATTPSFLTGFLPEGAWDQGFLSRCNIIYSGATGPTSLFAEPVYEKKLEEDLIDDLNVIGKMHGRMTFTEEAKAQIEQWHLAGGPPEPTHPKLVSYNARRTAHLLKLCMVACASSSDDLVITLDHFVEALDWLMEAEGVVPDIFKAMKTGGDGKVMEECWHFLYELWVREKKAVLEHRLYHFLQERTPAHNVQRILDVMEKSGLITKKFGETGHVYTPSTRKA